MQLIYNVLLFVFHCTGVRVCPQGNVKLVDGPTDEFEGRVEICNDNQWGTVCDDSRGEKDAIVVCTQLEYTGAHIIIQNF